MNILYHHRTQGGGAEGVHIREIVTAFRALGHEVELVSPPGVDPFSEDHTQKSVKSTEGTLLKRFASSFPQIMFEFMEIGYNLYAYFRLKNAVSIKKYDLVYERYAFFCIAGAIVAKSSRVPYILEVNEVSGIKRQRSQTMVGFCCWFEKKIFSRADIIIVVSQFLKDKLIERGVDGGKIMIVPNAVNLQQFDINVDCSDVQKAFVLEDKVVLTFVGRFSKWDRLDFLLDSFAKVHKQFPQSRLILVGDGPPLSGLWQQAQDLNIADFVYFTGEVGRKDIPYYIAVSDICLLSGSNPFGSPIALFEYMSMGKPVVVPRYGPIESIVQEGKEGFLFDPVDGERFVGALCELIKDEGKRRRFGERARHKILEDHTWEKNALNIIEFVKTIKQ